MDNFICLPGLPTRLPDGVDNYIYDRIADYQDWVHSPHPAGGAVEMERLKGGKMKDKIKEIKKEALEKLGEQENPEPWFSPEEVLELIAEIERLEAVREAVEEYLEVDSYGQSVKITNIKRRKLQQALAKVNDENI